jgi:hypothetical protein
MIGDLVVWLGGLVVVAVVVTWSVALWRAFR